MQERREAESDDQQVEPDPLFARQVPEERERQQGEDQGDRRDVLDKDSPENLAESREGLEGAFLVGSFRTLLLLDGRNADQFAHRSLELVGKGSPVLGAIDRVEESLRGAAVAPVHRRIRRGSQGHVGVGKQTREDRDHDQDTLTPFRQFAADGQEKEESRAHHVEQTDRRLHHIGDVGEISEAEIEQRGGEDAVEGVLPEEFGVEEENDQQRKEGHREGHVVIAHP